MQLDEFKQAWAAHGALLERSLAIDERLLRETLLRKVRFALAPYVLWRVVEVVLGLVTVVLVGSVLAAHFDEPRYLLVAGAVHVFAIGMTALTTYLLVSVARTDYGGAVTETRRALERIKLLEYRAFKWALLGGVLLWLPVAIVLIEGLTGAPLLARVDLPWLAANLAFGLVVLALGQAWSRKYVERPDLAPWARRFVDGVSGRSLRSVTSHLEELARFEREEPSLPA